MSETKSEQNEQEDQKEGQPEADSLCDGKNDGKNPPEENNQRDSREQNSGEQDSRQEEDFKTKYLYLAAELENQRKQFKRERENLFKFGGEKILQDLIEVIDNLERTIGAIPNNKDEKMKNIANGIDMVKKQFLNTLARHGLTPMESLGKEFDPSLHEAMAQEESDQEPNTVIRVFERGYQLNGRLLRAAKVIVAK